MKINTYTKKICNLMIIISAIIIIFTMSVLKHLSVPTDSSIVLMRHFLVFVVLLMSIQIATLMVLSGQLKDLTNKASTDVTGVHNKKALEKKIRTLEEMNDTLDVGIMMFDLNNLKYVNDHFGHEKGDFLIQSFASCLTRILTSNSFLARFGGDEFIIIQEKTTIHELEEMEKQLQSFVTESNKNTSFVLSYAVGYDVSYKNHYYLIDDLMNVVDKKMYQDKARKKQFMDKHSCTYDTCPLSIVSTDTIVEKLNTITSACSAKTRYAIIMSDISKFHLLNTNYGYATGNQILHFLVHELKKFPLALGTFRLYSDVFICIADVTDVDTDTLKMQLIESEKNISSNITSQFSINYFALNTGIFFTNQGTITEASISNANIALQAAKEMNSRICFYSKEMGMKEQIHANILHSFWQALKAEEFEIFFQPKLNGATKQINSAEALVRWCKNNQILYYPDQFIPLLEQTGDIIVLDYYIYEKAFAWIAGRIQTGKPMVPVSLNVSALHFHHPQRFINKINDLLNMYAIDTKYLIFEITETAYIHHLNIVNQVISQLHEKGIQISMDDFGSGYSSLNTLKCIQFDEVKIDKQFLANDLTDNGKIVLQELFHMLKRMNKSIVVEGVETPEIAEFLIREGCDELQGFLYYKPMCKDEFEALLLSLHI